jgi:chaperonin GroES
MPGIRGTGRIGSPDTPDRFEHVTTDPGNGLPIRMLHDRILVTLDRDSGERRNAAGIVIPATAKIGKRLSWASVMAIGASVRAVKIGDRVLFDPDERAEVELHGVDYVLLRERDLHAVAAERLSDEGTGLYL